ncbi:MAG: hypothetical protein FWG10_00975 [Eubacteriaceae bacterium]|nr:hypothetical protein [Eubacteriaceae bacterium]
MPSTLRAYRQKKARLGTRRWSRTATAGCSQSPWTRAYITDLGRAFPIYLNPTVTISNSSVPNTFVASASPNTNYNSGSAATYLRTGKDTPYGARSSLIQFLFTGKPFAIFVNAQLCGGTRPIFYTLRANVLVFDPYMRLLLRLTACCTPIKRIVEPFSVFFILFR